MHPLAQLAPTHPNVVGLAVGFTVGLAVGFTMGLAEGAAVVGLAVGFAVGLAVGLAVGWLTQISPSHVQSLSSVSELQCQSKV